MVGAAGVPLDVGNTTTVGWGLDLVSIMSLGLLALSRSGVRELRALCLGTAIVIVLLM